METVDNGLLSAQEAGSMLGVTEATLMTWRSIGKVRFIHGSVGECSIRREIFGIGSLRAGLIPQVGFASDLIKRHGAPRHCAPQHNSLPCIATHRPHT